MGGMKKKVGWIDTKESVLHSVKFYPTQTSSWIGIYTFFFKKTSVDHEILGLMFFSNFQNISIDVYIMTL